MLQDGFDDLPIFDKADNPHGALALGEKQGIDLIDLSLSSCLRQDWIVFTFSLSCISMNIFLIR
jgi:hypothetical protein